jgi:ABC-type nitrate/sulfonate/bicarbonate transport system substrate-binding protein
VLVIHERLLKKPDTVKALLRAIKDADDYINTNRKGTVEIMEKELNTKPDLINTILDSLEQRLTMDEVLVKNLCQSFRFLKAQKQIADDTKIDWDGAVSEQYLREIAPERVSLKKPIKCAS